MHAANLSSGEPKDRLSSSPRRSLSNCQKQSCNRHPQKHKTSQIPKKWSWQTARICKSYEVLRRIRGTLSVTLTTYICRQRSRAAGLIIPPLELQKRETRLPPWVAFLTGFTCWSKRPQTKKWRLKLRLPRSPMRTLRSIGTRLTT